MPTTHSGNQGGVTVGVAEALGGLIDDLGNERDAVEYAAFSTTQAMNALLEGDVARVGVVGIGAGAELRATRKRTRIGSVKLAAGHSLETEHEMLDATGGLDEGAVRAALERLAERGCEAIAVSGAYSVDDPEQELAVAGTARELGMPACCGHELTGAYGLETRTVSAAINAAVLPVVELTAGVVAEARGGRRRRPASGPARRRRRDEHGGLPPASFLHDWLRAGGRRRRGVAPAQGDRRDRPRVRRDQLQRLGSEARPAGPALDQGNGLPDFDPLGRQLGGRSRRWQHGADGATSHRRGGASQRPHRRVDLCLLRARRGTARRRASPLRPWRRAPGTRREYACVAVGERRYALTATCAAHALGLVLGVEAERRDAVLAAFAVLGRRLRTGPEEAARRMLDGAVEKIAAAAREARRAHDLGPDAPLVALGGAAAALAPEVARRLGAELVSPEHAEVLSSVGAALSLVRAEVVRTATAAEGASAKLAAARQAERECVESGASPATIATETSYERAEGVVRAVATGAVQLEAGAATRRPAADEQRLGAAAAALGMDAGRLSLVAGNDFYRVYYSGNGHGGEVAVVDPLGGVPLAESARQLLIGEGEDFIERLGVAVDDASVNLGVASMLPRVALVCGPRIVDLSDAREPRGAERGAAGD